MFPHISSANKDSQSYSNHTSMASRLEATNDADDDDDDDDDNDDNDDDDDVDSGNDSPQTSSFARNGREPSSNARMRIPSEQDENDVEMQLASDPDDNDDGDNDDGGVNSGRDRGTHEALNKERGTSQQSEVKAEK